MSTIAPEIRSTILDTLQYYRLLAGADPDPSYYSPTWLAFDAMFKADGSSLADFIASDEVGPIPDPSWTTVFRCDRNSKVVDLDGKPIGGAMKLRAYADIPVPMRLSSTSSGVTPNTTTAFLLTLDDPEPPARNSWTRFHWGNIPLISNMPAYPSLAGPFGKYDRRCNWDVECRWDSTLTWDGIAWR